MKLKKNDVFLFDEYKIRINKIVADMYYVTILSNNANHQFVQYNTTLNSEFFRHNDPQITLAPECLLESR